MSTRAFLIALATVAVPAIASAQPSIVVEADLPTAVVSYADLNVQTSAGQASLQSRIRRAANTLCLDRNVRDVHRFAVGSLCLNHAIASVRPQLESLAANGMPADLAAATIMISIKP